MTRLEVPVSSLRTLARQAGGLALATIAALLALNVGAAAAKPPTGSAQPDFGSSVIVFDPSMTTTQIQARVDAVAAQQVDDEMGSGRYALLFKPGTYGSAAQPLTFQVGY